VTVSLNGCPSAAGTTNVVVNAAPATPTASNGGPYCEGGTIALSTPTVAGATYSWTGPNGFVSSLQNPTRSNATLADGGSYAVTVTVNGCTSAAGSTTVTVNAVAATPTVQVENGGDPSFCNGTSITLVSSSAIGNQWFKDGNAISGANGQNLVATSAGDYTVQVANVTCPSAMSAPLTVTSVDCGVSPFALKVDEAGNSVLEPGESAVVKPSWLNPADSGPSISLTSSATSSTLTVDVANAVYGGIADGQSKFCTTCFGVTAGTARPAKHWDVELVETPVSDPASTLLPKSWVIHVGNSFSDVTTFSPFYGFVEALLHSGVTAGCSAIDPTYCPSSTVPREQMAAFIARALAGSDAAVPVSGTVGANSYNCQAGGNSLFSDVPETAQFCRHIHYIAAKNVTQGCVPGQFCRTASTPRDQMAAFIARAQLAPAGDGAIPPSYSNPTTGRSYNCGDGLANFFSDVPDTATFCRQIYYIWANGVVDGFPDHTFGPAGNVTRDQMSKFLVNAFNLQLYRP
jgi:hypothetical protein